jgi:hypothetical protein
MNEELNHFLMGAIAVSYAIASLFFFRFWRRTHDRLFVLFGIAFALLSAVRIAMFVLNVPLDESQHSLYWVRFVAYAVILLAIIDKNRGK